MQRLTVSSRADQVSAELVRRGIAGEARVRVVVEIVDGEASELPMAAIAQEGGAFNWLADEPDLYSDEDLLRAS